MHNPLFDPELHVVSASSLIQYTLKHACILYVRHCRNAVVSVEHWQQYTKGHLIMAGTTSIISIYLTSIGSRFPRRIIK